jgi:hypothetical protein
MHNSVILSLDDEMQAHGERIYVNVDPNDKAAFRALGGRYGHGLAAFHDLSNNGKFYTCATHETDPDPTQHDCCLYHDREYTLFYTQAQAQNLKAQDKSFFWRSWYWSCAPVRDDLEEETDIRDHLACVHRNSAFAHYTLDMPTYLNLRQQVREIAASFSYENPNPGLHEAKVKTNFMDRI